MPVVPRLALHQKGNPAILSKIRKKSQRTPRACGVPVAAQTTSVATSAAATFTAATSGGSHIVSAGESVHYPFRFVKHRRRTRLMAIYAEHMSGGLSAPTLAAQVSAHLSGLAASVVGSTVARAAAYSALGEATLVVGCWYATMAARWPPDPTQDSEEASHAGSAVGPRKSHHQLGLSSHDVQHDGLSLRRRAPRWAVGAHAWLRRARARLRLDAPMDTRLAVGSAQDSHELDGAVLSDREGRPEPPWAPRCLQGLMASLGASARAIGCPGAPPCASWWASWLAFAVALGVQAAMVLFAAHELFVCLMDPPPLLMAAALLLFTAAVPLIDTLALAVNWLRARLDSWYVVAVNLRP